MDINVMKLSFHPLGSCFLPARLESRDLGSKRHNHVIKTAFLLFHCKGDQEHVSVRVCVCGG